MYVPLGSKENVMRIHKMFNILCYYINSYSHCSTQNCLHQRKWKIKHFEQLSTPQPFPYSNKKQLNSIRHLLDKQLSHELSASWNLDLFIIMRLLILFPTICMILSFWEKESLNNGMNQTLQKHFFKVWTNA